MTENHHKIDIDDYQRLKWACRRGMLELDVLLGEFLLTAYPKLKNEEKLSFVTLLSYSDPEIFDWIMGTSEPANPHIRFITERIKQHAKFKI